MYEESPKRFDRIIAILIQLQSKKIIRAQELANRFEVSLRTIYRDIRTLEASGVPIYSEAGVGYALMEGYHLPPVMFTREEIGSFMAAGKLMQKFTDLQLENHYTSAMYKLKAVLRNADKDWVSTIDSKVLIQSPQRLFNDKAPNALTILFESIGDKKQVVLSYQSLNADEVTERLVEPVGVFHSTTYWYIFGYCHLRKDYRQFRTDRIQEIKKTDKLYSLEHKELETYLNKNKSADAIRVRIKVNKKEAKYLVSTREGYGFVSEKEVGNQIEMTFMSWDIEESFPRWYLMFGDFATIIEPEKLKNRVLELLEINKNRFL